MTGLKTDPLDPDKLKANLKTSRIGRKVVVFDRTASTNDIAAEYAGNPQNDGLVVFAEEQTAGRGRAGNRWFAGYGHSLLCSIVLTQSVLSPELLSLTCAVAAAEAIGNPATIKWPNDILLSGKKVAGILLESSAAVPTCGTQQETHRTYIVGIGINCHQHTESFPADLRPVATSIDIERRSICDRISLAKRLLTSLDHWLADAGQSPDQVIAHWRSLSTQLGRRVTLLFDGKKFAGNCIGLDPHHGLILQLDSGGIRIFPAAHTSIAM
jgi:BirA family biotin operon repressor/biotin-[acetyl-CoA-carboxylase] ligase